MAERKIVQIATMPAGEAGPMIQAGSFAALCDDGTVWVLVNRESGYGAWEQLPPVPQPEPPLSTSLPYENWGLYGNGPSLVPDGRRGFRKKCSPDDAGYVPLDRKTP